MTHWDNGRLMAYLDGELPPGDSAVTRDHVNACSSCGAAAAILREDSALLGAALAQLDVPLAGRAERVRAELRARAQRAGAPGQVAAVAGPRLVQAASAADRDRSGRPWRGLGSWRAKRMLEAALWVLFLAGGVSALVPGSPVREWLPRPTPMEEAQPALETAPASTAAAERAAQTGVRVAAALGRVVVALELPPGTELTVRLVEGDQAAVFAPAGARFTSADGRLEAEVPSGPVQVELPRPVQASLQVGGRTYVTLREGRLEPSLPADASTETELRFRVP